MREIVLDTETTGLDPSKGHRIVEIGCVELVNRIATGATFQTYLNPERDMPADAFAIHGLSESFLKNQRNFRDVSKRFLDFIKDSPLVIHNAAFDGAFLNMELTRIKLAPIPADRLIDTLFIARRKHPGTNTLDALCTRYGVDASKRVKHGALLDAELLSEVYVELIDGRQSQFALGGSAAAPVVGAIVVAPVRARETPIPERLTDADVVAHIEFIASIKEAIWEDYLERATQ